MEKNWLVDAWVEVFTINDMSEAMSKAQAFKDYAVENNIEPTVDNFIEMLEAACNVREAQLLGACSCGSESFIQVDANQYVCTECNRPRRIMD